MRGRCGTGALDARKKMFTGTKKRVFTVFRENATAGKSEGADPLPDPRLTVSSLSQSV
jgi:hypothetical protein